LPIKADSVNEMTSTERQLEEWLIEKLLGLKYSYRADCDGR
jgi:hypothetical protein